MKKTNKKPSKRTTTKSSKKVTNAKAPRMAKTKAKTIVGFKSTAIFNLVKTVKSGVGNTADLTTKGFERIWLGGAMRNLVTRGYLKSTGALRNRTYSVTPLGIKALNVGVRKTA